VVALGLAGTRTRAQALIRAGRVLVDDVPVDKPGARVSDTARVRVRGSDRRFVSRGGEKLEGALRDLAVPVRGRRCLDLGASTGGFTDCLLREGAAHVTCVDVGYGQLAPGLRGDPRVAVRERTNARDLRPEDLPGPVDLVCADLSFISLAKVLPRIAQLWPGAEVLALVKPQFELGPESVGRGGVVRDDALRARAVDAVCASAAELGYAVRGRAESRLPGPKGNREVFVRLALSRGGSAGGGS